MIDYQSALNTAQYEAVTASGGPLLVVAGAGSGKTRTIVYRIAWLSEQGVSPHSMLLLTFTRKAAAEMLQRAARLLEQGLAGLQGGTFHGFAYGVLRQFKPVWLGERKLTVMDNADMTAAIKQCREKLGLGRGDRSFPRSQNILAILSKARNKEVAIEETVRREACHLLPHAAALAELNAAYAQYRREHGLLDYDDLLFELESLLREREAAAGHLRGRYEHLLVDEYQDTNLVQARLVRLLRGEGGNVMAVGDDAQSIYAFRGANVRNMLDFPALFPGTRVITLEENYRSARPVLDVANALLERAPDAVRKVLFPRREGGESVRLVVPRSDRSQADLLVRRISELLREYPPHEIAVLFRAGFHSYPLEAALVRAEIPFRKYGGLRYMEAAHVKDLLSYARLLINPLDLPSFQRIAALHPGLGPKSARKLHAVALSGDPDAAHRAFSKYPGMLEDMGLLDSLREQALPPSALLQRLAEHYHPRLEAAYPDDWPRRRQGLEEIVRMAAVYAELDLFVADLALESPEEDEDAEGRITLSTVHSAKGLEWDAVLIIDLVEERFPSRHAQVRAEDFEEERRLMYVACTRARKRLELYAPATVYSRGDHIGLPAVRSPFLRELPDGLYEEWDEMHGLRRTARARGPEESSPVRLTPPDVAAPAGGDPLPAPEAQGGAPRGLGYCMHKIFGRGKKIRFVPPDKFQVNFPGFGVKTILADFLAPAE
ncbi:MAG: ATP-dependent helicase [Deltaproteobacteria bacterium]|nr:ATP-dependent helicase [Deltaproteobacteria bacterium]